MAYNYNKWAGGQSQGAEYLHSLGESTSVANTTYTEEEVELPLIKGLKGQNICIGICGFTVEFTPNIGDADAYFQTTHLSLKSKTAIGNVSDEDILALLGKDFILFTSGATILEKTETIWFQKPLLIAKETLYIGHYQTTNATRTLHVKIWYVPRFVAQNQLIQSLLNQYN